MARSGAKTVALRRARKKARAKPRRKSVAAVKPRPGGSRAIEAAMAALAHDIRTPLTGILALAELLSSSELGERERRWARNIKDAAEHLARLTTVVTDAVRADAGDLPLQRENFSPRRLAETMAATLHARAEASGLTAGAEIADDLPPVVVGDPVRLRAALENLIDNAVKFTARGAVRLDVSARTTSRAKTRLTFAVTDSGIGLTPDEIKKLFRPFSQANEAISRRFGGTGLGLTLVRRLARAMGGDLTVMSRPKAGSTFTLSVTVAPAADQDRGAQARGVGAARPSMRALTILCAEDNPYGRVVMNAILTELGHQVDFVGSGAAAVESVARGGYDAVLMDVTLPGVDGIEATRRIRALKGTPGRIPVIGISALTSPADKMRADEAGMNDYLEKPVTPKMLADVLGQIRR